MLNELSMTPMAIQPPADVPAGTATLDAVADVLIRHHAVVTREALRPDTTLGELGLDSLSLMEFVFAIEDRFQVRIPEQDLDPRKANLSLRDVCRALDAAVAARGG